MFTNHPEIEVAPNSRDRRLLKIGFFVLGMHFLMVSTLYPYLPDTIPLNYNHMGEVKRYGNTLHIWFLPLLSLGMFYGIRLMIKKVKPYRMNYPVKVTEKNAPALYRMSIHMFVILGLGIVVLFLALSLHTILQSFDLATYDFQYFFIPAMLITTLIPFYYIFRMFKLPKS